MKNLESDINIGLSGILYNLYYIRDINSSAFYNTVARGHISVSTGQEIETFIKALEWAMQHMNYDFKNILPNIRFSSNQIVLFMERYLNVLNRR